jgi:hypothetical protein
MNRALLITTSLLIVLSSSGQSFTVSADKMNVLYIGIDNPISVTVERYSCESITVGTNNGKITGSNCRYIFSGGTVGVTNIAVYKKVNGKMQVIGIWPFRVKHLPPPVFKIASGKLSMPKAEIANQQYVRAELENFDINIKYTIDSFKVCIIPNDTCKFGTKTNYGNKISEEIRNDFKALKQNDAVVFKDIFIKNPDGSREMLAPLVITIRE